MTNRADPDAGGEPPALARARAAWSAQAGAADIARALSREVPALVQRLSDTVAREVPAYRASGNPQVLPDLSQHLADMLADGVARLQGRPGDDPGFVRRHAQRCAEQRFPLEAVLAAQGQAWRALLGAAGDNAPQALVDLVLAHGEATALATAADYVAHTRLLADAEGDRRTELLGLLLGGVDESDMHAARLLKRAGYLAQRLSFCVALVQATDPLEMAHPARAQRIIDALGSAVAPLSVRLLAGVRSNMVTALFSDPRRVSGWTAPRAALADRLRPALQALGPAVLVGLSADQPSTAFIPRALAEAAVALDLAHVGDRVVAFAQVLPRRRLIHRGAEAVRASLPAWWAPLHEADAKAGGALLATLRALADADINVQRAARVLGLHANTVYARLARVTELSGLNPQRFHELDQLLLVADCASG